MAGDPAGNPFAHLKSHVLKALGSIADGNRKVKFVPLFVHHEQRPGIGTEVFRHLLHDGLEDGIQVQRRGQGFGYVVENAEFLEVSLPLGARGLGHHSFLKRLQRGWAYYRQRLPTGATNLCNPRIRRGNPFPIALASGPLSPELAPSAEGAIAPHWRPLLPSISLISRPAVG